MQSDCDCKELQNKHNEKPKKILSDERDAKD